MGRLTDFGPTLLVPAAWTVTVAVHVGAVTARTLFVALVVMDVLLVAFYLAGRAEMTDSVLGIWKRVLLVGLAGNLLGTADLALTPGTDPFAPVTVLTWMVVPGVAYVYTGRAVGREPYRAVYFLSAAGSLFGAAVYALALAGLVGGRTPLVAGIAVVGLGQTAGIVAAAYQNR